MTDVVESQRLTGYDGDIKTLVIISNAACDTGHVIDTNIDSTANVEQIFNTAITRVRVQETDGADKTATWDNTTGVITLGSITAGVHNITLEGY